MTLTLTIDRDGWLQHVRTVASSVAGLVPVVKGNGYGLGRSVLLATAQQLAPHVAVGTVWEAADALRTTAPGATAPSMVVLTPTLEVIRGIPASTVLTVGGPAHVDALLSASWTGAVQVKLRSAMHRYGVVADDLPAFEDHIGRAGLTRVGYQFHPPLVEGERSDERTVAELEAWLPHLDPQLPVSISHLAITAFRLFQQRHPERSFTMRLGTHLWHGDKSFLHLQADVLDHHQVGPGATVGYHQVRISDGGTIVLVGAGSAHGIAPLADQRSPFHHRRQRLTLVESPHMHTSMLLVGRHQVAPEIGDLVDVQRPLITTTVDQVVWR